jgi:hypothetical protein
MTPLETEAIVPRRSALPSLFTWRIIGCDLAGAVAVVVVVAVWALAMSVVAKMAIPAARLIPRVSFFI